MSISSIRTYIRTVMSTVDADHKEWTDGFNFENIPQNIIHKSWHLTFNPTSPISTNQNCFKIDYPVTLNVFLLGGRDMSEVIDSANTLGQSIYQECLDHSNRLGITATSTAKIINIVPSVMSINPYGQDNDNTVRLQLDFIFEIYIELT